MKKTVAVALSGGLDSAVAASLLLEKDFQVIGIHFFTGYEPVLTKTTSDKSIPNSPVETIASQLGISLETVDCSLDFSREVVNYFLKTYSSGKTPNPCIVCNQRIKFGVVLNYVRRLGAEALATGHYARIAYTAEGKLHLLKGLDPAKDQSYFLSRLTQEQLGHAIFPLGVFTKDSVREMAQERGLTKLTAEESQELCFVNDVRYSEFLTAHGIPGAGPGPIVNSRGDVLGQHQGLHRHTIGQRRGMGVPGPQPYYVLRLDLPNNRLVVGTKTELAAGELTVADIHWIGMDPPEKPLTVQTRIRYRHKEAPSVVTPIDATTAKVTFLHLQNAVTPGQAAVFYEGERILGGGWICQPARM